MNQLVLLNMWLILVDHHEVLQLILSTGVLYTSIHNDNTFDFIMFIVKYFGQNLLVSNHSIWTAVKQQRYMQI